MTEVVRFEALCDALRRNDPKITDIPLFALHGFGHRLGEALQGNSHVSSMRLSLSRLLAEDDESADGVALLLRYISESDLMRKIDLRSESPKRPLVIATTLATLFLQAIVENPYIEDLSLYTKIPSEKVALLLRTTQSLKTLIVDLVDLEGAASSQQLVAAAFGANRTLERLELRIDPNSMIAKSVLLQLGSHPCLRELKLYCWSCQRLAYSLRSTSLKQLELSNVSFDKECMECLVEGLHSNQSLTNLSFSFCCFDPEATDVFFSFMRSDETRSCIRELSLYKNSFANSSAGSMVASMLIMPDDNQGTGSSIGSSLEVLNLNFDFPRFNDAFAARIQLASLHPPTYRDVHHDWESLCRCLPQLVNLRELTIPLVHPRNASSWNFVVALQKNGSLQRVALAETNREEAPFFNEREMHLIQSISKRNEGIPILVDKIRLDSDNDDDYGEDKFILSLLPIIFEAAKQAPRTAPNSMLIALLGAGDSIGPRCGVKRSRQHTLA